MILKNIKDALQGKAPLFKARSLGWPRVRREHLEAEPQCAACGGVKTLEVHHKQAFHTHPELELDPRNLITLCESKNNGLTCHLLVGHKGNYKNINPKVELDAKYIEELLGD